MCGCFWDVFEFCLQDLLVSDEGVQVLGLSVCILERRLGQTSLSTTLSCGAPGQFQMDPGANLFEQGQHRPVHFLLVQVGPGRVSNRFSNSMRVPIVVWK
jgi:hypothetical protein